MERINSSAGRGRALYYTGMRRAAVFCLRNLRVMWRFSNSNEELNMNEQHTEYQSQLRVFLVLAAVLLGGCTSPHYSATHEQVEQRIASARTRADHRGLAQFFEQEAQEAKKRAEKHRAMSKRYTDPVWTGRGSWEVQLRGHCDTLVGLYEKAEQENKALAALHREIAAETNQ